MRSRLTKKLRQQSQRNLAIFSIGTIFLLYFLIQYGLPVLVNASAFLSGKKDISDSSQNKLNNVYVPSPLLDPLPEATNSARTIVSGTSEKNLTVNLYINDNLEDKTTPEDDGSFRFEDVILTKGKNTIKVQAENNDRKESDFSDRTVIYFLDKPPQLSIDSPSEGENFPHDFRNADIKGKTDLDVKVTVNDLWAIVDEKGYYSYSYPLQNGENTIKIVATDKAGNKTEKEVKVTYSP